jgi:glycosyltransferase involved in cell wall biosynthesis
VAVVGVSERRTCGVRDHAMLLAGALGERDVHCSIHWLWREDHSLRGSRSEFAAFAASLPQELARERAEAVILHYSVFSYAHRGIPLLVPPVLGALRRSGLPTVVLLHEYAYPWRRSGFHGTLWAATQRIAIAAVMRAAAAAVVTAPFRSRWLASRRWLPRRPIGFAPVFSNLPPPAAAPHGEPGAPIVGLFGWAYEGAASQLVLRAIELLRERGLDVRLRLLGAPGPETPAAAAWTAAARAIGIDGLLSFSGVLGEQELSDALAGCAVLLHPEPSGPTSRKGTLAASLASGRPVVAIDGPRRWQEIVDAEAALVVEPTAEGLAAGVAELLGDDARRERLGARGGAFAREQMGLARTAAVVVELLESVLRRDPDRPGR